MWRSVFRQPALRPTQLKGFVQQARSSSVCIQAPWGLQAWHEGYSAHTAYGGTNALHSYIKGTVSSMAARFRGAFAVQPHLIRAWGAASALPLQQQFTAAAHPRGAHAAADDAAEAPADDVASDTGRWLMTSTRRKRVAKMNKHKWKKRRKRERMRSAARKTS
ncbi:hypothetical protein JKP88DRAFT_346502 [Tribonema minus]|uniref:Ribosomal protein mS38 C-terminal domain-containing protein n=1 Tax=Tribonema minus TaxID=303371 RepID=A0A836CIA2_9STRA|nr:hypothetical protein JKP88DRAFT_346502 [Tribonema minus]